jgi:hypothetical protein
MGWLPGTILRTACGSRRALAAITLAWSLLLGGCAFNDYGTVSVRHWKAPGGDVIQLDGWGAHLVTVGADRGLTLGRTTKTYFCPSGDGALPMQAFDAHALLALLDAAHGTLVESNDAPALGDLAEPLAVVSHASGVVLDANRFRTGVSLGVRTFGGVAIPLDFEGVVWIHHDSTDPTQVSFYVQEYIP